MPKKKKSIKEMTPERDETGFIPEPFQEEAIKHKEGPLLIVAGAGTGKTGVITRRIARLIETKAAKPSEILALTFSEKAAREMERRVDELVPYGYVETHISTFHSFGYDVINENFAELKVSPDWTLMKKAEQVIFLAENIEALGLDIYRPAANPAGYVTELASFTSKLKDNLITPGDYGKYASDRALNAATDAEKEEAAAHSELARFYMNYERLKLEKNRMDFGDLIMAPCALLEKSASARERYAKKFKYVLVDEFQDTNYAQFELVKRLLGPARNITVVGDDDQMIYRFRGAAISNIMQFKEIYSGAKVVVLKKNYRSIPAILDFAYKSINNNTDRLEVSLKIDKKLESAYVPSEKGGVFVREFREYSEEADFIAGEIEKLTEKGALAYSDFAVLVRSKNDGRLFFKTLERRGIPYSFSGDEGLYSKNEVRFFINFCRTLSSPYEYNPLFDVAVSEYYGVSPYTMAKIAGKSRDFSVPAVEIIRNPAGFAGLEIEAGELEKIKTLNSDINNYLDKIAQGWGAGELLYDFVKSKRVFESLLRKKCVEAEVKAANIAAFFDVLKQFSLTAEYDTVPAFAAYIDLRQKAGDNAGEDLFEGIEENVVHVMTVHKAKGLEFKAVFVPALAQDKFPVKKRGGAPFPLPEALMKDLVDEALYFQEEERRLFYVAITRAKERLYLTYSAKYEGRSERKPSIFLSEAGFKAPEVLPRAIAEADKLKYFERKEKAVAPPLSRSQKRIVLSNYQIDDYRTCPYKYKIVHILKLPIRENPNIIYGQALHKVAAEFYRAKAEGRIKPLEEYLSIFESMWKPTGFLSREHERRRYQKGAENIRAFYEKEAAGEESPLYIEKSFEFKIGQDISVVGRWDRIDLVGGRPRVVDYKSSEAKDLEKAKKKLSSESISRQLKLYCLAYSRVFGEPCLEAGIYFFESAVLVTKKFKPATIEDYEGEIVRTAEDILSGNFSPDPDKYSCNMCAFNNMCEFSKADVLF